VSAEQVARALSIHRGTLDDAARIFVAFSGGLDSTVLLHAACTAGLAQLVALHVNHGLHGDAVRWERRCAAFCASLGVAYHSEKVDVLSQGRGLEAAAREARYAYFEGLLQAGDLLLLAHHQDDQAETLLLRLLRGAGPDGLAAMPVARSLGRGRLLRPLLGLPRSTLAQYAQVNGLAWIDDPSNVDEQFDRNYLRHRILPLVEARWPAYREVVSRTAGLLREAREHRGGLAPATVFSVTGDPGMTLADVPQEPAAAALVIRSWLRGHGLAMPGRARLLEFLRQLRDSGGASLQTAGWVLTRYRDAIYAHSPHAPPLEERHLLPGVVMVCSGIGSVRLEATAAPAAAAVPPGKFFVRTRTGGERLAAASGGHRRVKQLLQEAGVPPWWRERVPLLFERHAQTETLLAVGPFAAAPRLADLGLTFTWRPDSLGDEHRVLHDDTPQGD
jgi:tRNA(Ile)-lysidine synthase